LDHVTHALEFYFGLARKQPFDSHDDFVRNVAAFAKEKGLIVSDKLINLAKELKRDISDYSDYQIAHEKSLRTLFGAGYQANGQTRIFRAKLCPKDHDKQVDSKEVRELWKAIDAYLEQVFDFIKSNSDKTVLKLARTISPQP
jgi:hypothetical protein